MRGWIENWTCTKIIIELKIADFLELCASLKVFGPVLANFSLIESDTWICETPVKLQQSLQCSMNYVLCSQHFIVASWFLTWHGQGVRNMIYVIEIAIKRPQFIFQIFFSWVWYDPQLTYSWWPFKVKLFWEVASTKEPGCVQIDFCCETGNTVNRRPQFHLSWWS